MFLIAYDMRLKRPACLRIATELGAEARLALEFDVRHWLLVKTPDTLLYPVTNYQVEVLVQQTNNAHPLPQLSLEKPQ